MQHGHTPAHDSADASRPPAARVVLKNVLLGALYLTAIFLLIFWEYRDRLGYLGSSCVLTEEPPPSQLYSLPYVRILDWASNEAASHVTLLVVPAELQEIQDNACLGRAYLADIVRLLAEQHPAELVIDKFYSEATCASSPESTRDFVQAVAAIPAPVVVGESTDALPHERAGACLVRKPQLDFHSGNVHHGLTRLNFYPEKIPLQWRVLPEADPPRRAEAPPTNSLALEAVEAYDPGYAHRPAIRALLESERHPYASLNAPVPQLTTTALLCQYGTPAMLARWKPSCGPPSGPAPLLGKVVVIGAQRLDDYRPVLERPMWGYELQAHYIEALLSGTFLRTFSFWAAFSTFASFIFITEAVPTLLAYLRPQWKHRPFICHAYQHRRYFWTTFWAVAFILGTSVVAITLRYLPPLLMFGDIALVAISRLLVFAAESTEHPLLHSHKKGRTHHAK